MSYATYFLTCADNEEAKKIAEQLLSKRLVACAKYTSVASSYWWEGKIEHADEELLILESTAEKFDVIDAEVKKLHSYDQYVLTMQKVDRTNPPTLEWLNKELL